MSCTLHMGRELLSRNKTLDFCAIALGFENNLIQCRFFHKCKTSWTWEIPGFHHDAKAMVSYIPSAGHHHHHHVTPLGILESVSWVSTPQMDPSSCWGGKWPGSSVSVGISFSNNALPDIIWVITSRKLDVWETDDGKRLLEWYSVTGCAMRQVLLGLP
jgi:hypothetical protein